ncbi:hypothetical protein [Streptomyces violaceus]|uniref:Lipoprotein n=2 Tax=Streptomyces violaceus TaxID=1936 RepID=A0ABY9U4K2_STRVL|nr:hypothetical protein [Streptomyces janthinus]WND17217.1 hypothetical protein RI060_07600 [Streptomyces janthinus]GGS39734.1 hypothetical protein GCM10010270_06500 [Streptomyces janthinus]
MRAAVRVPVVLMTFVIGAAGAVSCSNQNSPGSAAPHRSKAAASGPEPSEERTAPRAADLPKHPVSGDKRPGLGTADTMATGYTGKDFLAGLSKDWKLKLGKPVEQEMPDGKKRTYVHGRGGNGVTVSAGYADHENMSSLLCRTGANQPDGPDFLAACTRLDVAGVDHGKASSWLKQARKETDSLYEKRVAETGNKKEYVVSGVFTSGPVTMILHRAYDKYSLRILGGAVAQRN